MSNEKLYNIPIIARGRIIEPGDDAIEFGGRTGARSTARAETGGCMRPQGSGVGVAVAATRPCRRGSATPAIPPRGFLSRHRAMCFARGCRQVFGLVDPGVPGACP